MHKPPAGMRPLLAIDSELTSTTVPVSVSALQIMPSDGVEATLAAAAERQDVIFVTSDRRKALEVSATNGVLPVLLGEAGDNPLADAAVAQARTFSDVSPYFDSAFAASVLQLSRLRPSEVRANIARRLQQLIEAAGSAGGVTIYGAGTIGRQAIHAARLAGIPVKAILDGNAALHGTRIEGIEVRPVSSIAKGADIVVPALGSHLAAISGTLRSHGVGDIMSLSEIYYVSRRPGEPETDYLDDLYANRHRYQSLFMLLADERSREVLSAVIRHRMTLSTEPLLEVVERGHPQWFDPAFLPRTDNDVFVDGGAFDGDTALGYAAARGSGYKHIHAFELDQDVAARARKNTEALANVTIHNVGLSNRAEVVAFRKTGSTDGAIGTAGDGAGNVQLDTIDAVVEDRITMLKLDVEGEEARALAGARRHLVEDRPTLAIALYHKAHDLWDLPRRVLDALPDYRLHLRHYTDVAYETVLYANGNSRVE